MSKPVLFFIQTKRRPVRARRRAPRKAPGKALLNLALVLAAGILLIWFAAGWELQGQAIATDYQEVLAKGLPPVTAQPVVDFRNRSFWQEASKRLSGLDFADPRYYLGNQISLIGAVGGEAAAVFAESNPVDLYEKDYETEGWTLDQVPENDPENSLEPINPDPQAVRVVLYNTHNAETYLPTFGKERVEGQNGGVVQVAAELEKELSQVYGIKTARSVTIHDYPSYERSYGNSEKTAQALLAANPDTQVVLDIHRDAGLVKKEVVEIKGKPAAPVMIVVGNLVRWEGQPLGQGNMAFAERLKDKMNQEYPGLLKEIRVKSGRYNQHLHPHALLLEFGSSLNTLEEAEYSARLVAHVVSLVLKDLAQERM